MILCLVTDRRRLGTALGAQPGEFTELLRVQVAAAAAAGIDYVQVREPDLEARELIDLVRGLIAALGGSSTKLLVNDRVDVALAARASGVHLKEASFLPDQVRALVPKGFVISCAVHTSASAIARKSADLLLAGTVMPTASKRPVEYLDRAGLEAIVRAAAGTPVLGIGGLDLPSIPLLADSCADGMAAIGAFIPGADERLPEFVQKRVRALRLAFDSASRRT